MKYWFLGALLLAGCNKVPFDAVTIRPTYGWQDGCTSVKISGASLGDSISATIGGTAVTDIERPEDEEDRTFFFFAVTPPNAEVGVQDVTVTSDGKTDTITGTGGFYYVACPAAPEIEAFAPTEGLTAGATISMSGCNIDTAALSVRVIDATGAEVATADLTSDCGTAYASFAAPDLADGTYMVLIVDGDGTVVHPATGDPIVCAASGDDPDSGDSAAPEPPVCDPAIEITYGGEE